MCYEARAINMSRLRLSGHRERDSICHHGSGEGKERGHSHLRHLGFRAKVGWDRIGGREAWELHLQERSRCLGTSNATSGALELLDKQAPAQSPEFELGRGIPYFCMGSITSQDSVSTPLAAQECVSSLENYYQ